MSSPTFISSRRLADSAFKAAKHTSRTANSNTDTLSNVEFKAGPSPAEIDNVWRLLYNSSKITSVTNSPVPARKPLSFCSCSIGLVNMTARNVYRTKVDSFIRHWDFALSDVRQLSPSFSMEASVEWYEELAVLLRDKISSRDVYAGTDSFTRAISRYLRNGGKSLETIQRALPAFRNYLQVLYEAALLGDSVQTPQDYMDEEAAEGFEGSIRWFKVTRCPFIFSTDGHVGLRPVGAKIGDEVFAILGC